LSHAVLRDVRDLRLPRAPGLWFQKVPEAKAAKDRQHFDLRVMGPLERERDRLVALGASVLAEHGGLYVMSDPEGNEFCLET
jgi:hypothetical protein